MSSMPFAMEVSKYLHGGGRRGGASEGDRENPERQGKHAQALADIYEKKES